MENHSKKLSFIMMEPALESLFRDLKDLNPSGAAEIINTPLSDLVEAVSANPSSPLRQPLILMLELLEISGVEEIPKATLGELFPLKDDFHKAYEFFKQAQMQPFNESFKTRLLGQQLSLSIENIGHKALHPFLSKWWATRESSISLLLDPDKKECRLHPDLVTALNRLALLHQDLLTESVFPVQIVENSLNYLLSLDKEESFSPAPIEVGYLLLFFGQEQFLERFLHNSLNIEGVEADEIVEFGFRMIRAQRMKTKAFSLNSDFGAADLEKIEEDHAALSHLLARLHSTRLLVKEAA